MDESTSKTPLGDFTVARATVDQAGSVLELQDDLARWMLEHGIEQRRPEICRSVSREKGFAPIAR